MAEFGRFQAKWFQRIASNLNELSYLGTRRYSHLRSLTVAHHYALVLNPTLSPTQSCDFSRLTSYALELPFCGPLCANRSSPFLVKRQKARQYHFFL